MRTARLAIFPALAIAAFGSTARAQTDNQPVGGSGSTTTPGASSSGNGSMNVGGDSPANVGSPNSAAAGGNGADTKGPGNPADSNLGPTDPGYDVNGSAGARAVGVAPPGVNYSNFMDTRLTWTFGDDDFTHSTGQLIPLSPTFSIGDRPQYRLFFDGLNSQYAGRENLTHLVMYKKMPGFLPHLTTEASVVLRFDLAALSTNTNNVNSALYDAGSYIRVFYNTREARPNEGLSLTFFPLDTDRFRLGYLYDISWGGTNASLNQSIFPRIQGSSPGLKVQYDTEKFYAFAGFKTAQIVEPLTVLNPATDNDVEVTRVGETNYGFLGGAGYDPAKFLRLDADAGYFQQGKFDLDDVRGQNIYTYGGSARIVVHHDMPVPQSVDFLLYKNDPFAPMVMFAPEKYDPKMLAWSISAEGDLIDQHLKNFDAAGQTKMQPAIAAALQGVVRAGYARFSATGIYRDLNYVVRNVPGFIPFETLPQNTKTDPEMFGSLSADYYIEKLHVTPQISGGIQLPSTFKSEFSDGGVPASRTIVVRQQGNESILPYDSDRTPIYQARLSVKWQLSSMLGATIWGQFVRDNNGTLVEQDPTE
ncbi:MAG: hypothetical protein ABI183_02780, partial [Polyangiaceae bacterium]